MGERIERWKKYYTDNEVNKKVKTHFEEHKTLYSCIATGVVTAGFMAIIMRKTSTPHSIEIKVKTGHDAIVAGKDVVMKNVNFITQNRQGPPSWVVRCVETNDIFSSQNAAANAMDLPASEISKQLNGLMDNVRGFHFERICLAA